MDSVFNKFEDEDSDDMPRKRKLVPLDYGDEDKGSSKGSVNTEEKRKHIKSLIEKIPTAKPELFAYPLDWSIVDSVSIKQYKIWSAVSKMNLSEFVSSQVLTLISELSNAVQMMLCIG